MDEAPPTKLSSLTIQGFRSIRDLKGFAVRPMNVLVGANGSGKSNFVEFFRMLRALCNEGLQRFVIGRGGADGFLFNGPKVTPRIRGDVQFGENRYQFTLAPTASGELMIESESVPYGLHRNDMGGGRLESLLKDRMKKRASWNQPDKVYFYVWRAMIQWVVYHFHDTSLLAAARRECPVEHHRELGEDAGNIAAFLLHLRENHAATYRRIRDVIQGVAPYIEDFLLEPRRRGDGDFVKLEWNQRGVPSFPFQPYHLSDGTLRFICLATAVLQPKPPPVLILDEPELGLHPYALDLLVDLLRDASRRGVQVIVSTQSPAFLNRCDPEDIVTVDREGGASVFRRLEEEPLAAWLEDYTLGELWQKNVIGADLNHE
ncbi:MAG: AAA family ATPase [Verrucomicrobiae bacterium]|nr:AAA family ATPase [Verrucomicrobiae bacterium]